MLSSGRHSKFESNIHDRARDQQSSQFSGVTRRVRMLFVQLWGRTTVLLKFSWIVLVKLGPVYMEVGDPR